MDHGICDGAAHRAATTRATWFLAFSTANDLDLPQASGPWRQMTCLNDELLDPVYLAAVEAVEEAVLNAMLAAEDTPMARPSGTVCRAIDGELVRRLLEASAADRA